MFVLVVSLQIYLNSLYCVPQKDDIGLFWSCNLSSNVVARCAHPSPASGSLPPLPRQESRNVEALIKSPYVNVGIHRTPHVAGGTMAAPAPRSVAKPTDYQITPYR